MKSKLIYGIFALVMGLFITGCSDEDDYAISTTPLLTNQSVVTGSADVTPTSAILHGTVKGLEGQAGSAYATGFYYGDAADALTEKAGGTGGADFTATIAGSVNQTIYYQAFVTLQGKLTYTGEVKSLVLTNARAVTGNSSEVQASKAVLAGTLTDFPADAVCGVILSSAPDAEQVRAGVRVAAAQTGAAYSVEVKGLVPATTYYYVAYLDLGAGMVYGTDVKSFTTQEHVFDVDNDLVDLGLSTKWAKYNVGTTSESEMGGLFAFGDMAGFNASLDVTDYASADIYKTAKDIAYKAFGGKVTMPTIADFEELFALCEKEWTEVEGVSGYKFTGPNGNSIFLPAAGARVANTLTGEGTIGSYLSGSINATDPQFAMAYQFSNGADRRITSPVYQALAVRPVSTAKNVPFVKELLYQKWYLDNGQDGKQHVFEGPFTQWGATDHWGTVSNGEPNIHQNIHWEMGTNQGWIGYTYGKDYGYMEFKEDGTVQIHRIAEDGAVTDETGHYTIDEVHKIIDIDLDVICGSTWLSVKQGKLNILSLTQDGLQIALPDGDYCYSLNYYSQAKADADAAIPVLLNICDSNWSNSYWDVELAAIAPAALAGQHTFVFEGAITDVMVFTLDFGGMSKRYPNAFVRVDDIKLDGTSIPFDANRFYYGDIEDNGKYRVQLFNVYGQGSVSNQVPFSPFSKNENLSAEPAIVFNRQLEITCTIFPEANGAGKYTPNVVVINPSWEGPWNFNQGAQLEVKYENFQYSLVNSSFSIKYESDIHAAGSIMTFVEVADLFTFFPDTHATLDKLCLDEKEVTGYDASKVVDTNDKGNYRLELWNCYGATKGNCAFGTADGDVIKELGFNQSIQLDFTFRHLFKVPLW